jgi:hypothetical protein
MGSWGFGILDDDFARDVYDRYTDAHGAGEAPASIVQTLRNAFAASVSDPDEGPVFWLAVAQAQWECSQLTPDVGARVQELVAQGSGLARWADAGPAELARRQAALARFAKKIQTPRAGTRRRKTPATEVAFTVGDCLAIDVDEGHFAAAIVTRHEPGSSASHILSVLDFFDTSPPVADVFAAPAWLVVTPTPNLTIVKCCVYGNGFKRHGKKYRVVTHVEPAQVPQPLTLGLGNWGNVGAISENGSGGEGQPSGPRHAGGVLASTR